MSGPRVTDDFGSGLLVDGRYRVTEDRAAGGYGGVHLATGRPVRLRVAPGDSPEMMRLKRKLPAVAALDHPALIPVLDVGHDERGLYLVEARVDGESLSALVGEAQPADRVADVVRQLARVLADAHGRGIAHGALRPGCVWLQQTLGRSDYVRLAGIGLGDTPFAEDAGAWAAPEVVDGQAPDARADLYALGLIGRALLGGLDPAEAVAGALPGAPPALVEVLDALVRRSPSQRPPSAVAVLGPLERATQVGAQRGARAMSDTIISTGPIPPVDPSARARVEASAPTAPSRPAPEVTGSSAQIETTVDIERLDFGGARRGKMMWAAVVGLLLAIIGYLLLREPATDEGADTATVRVGTPAPGSAPAPEAPPSPEGVNVPAEAPAPPDAGALDASPDAAPADAATAPTPSAVYEALPDRPTAPSRRRRVDRATKPDAKSGPGADRPSEPAPLRPRPGDTREAPAPTDDGPNDGRAYEKL